MKQKSTERSADLHCELVSSRIGQLFSGSFLPRVGCFQHRGQLPPRNPLSYGRSPLRLKQRVSPLQLLPVETGDENFVHSPVHILCYKGGVFSRTCEKKATSCVNDRQRKANCHLNICRQILSLSECTLGG